MGKAINFLAATIVAATASMASATITYSSFSGGAAVGSSWNPNDLQNYGSLQYYTTAPNLVNSQMTVAVNGGNGAVGAQTFRTGASQLQISAFSVVGSGTPNGLSIHLFKIDPTQVNNPGTGGSNYALSSAQIGGEFLPGSATILGVGGPANSGHEFTLTGADRITLDPNTTYAFELWNTGTTAFFWDRNSGPATNLPGGYGQAYSSAVGGSGDFSAGAASSGSSSSRFGISSAGPRFGTLAIYGVVVPEPTSLALVSVGAIGFLRRRRA